MDNSITLNNRKYLGRKQIVLDCKFQIENDKQVQKVLAVNGKPILSDVSISTGHISFSGKVNVKLIYIAENGEKQSMNCIADFGDSFENSEIEIGDNVIIDLKVVDVTTPSIKSNEVKVACILDAGIILSKNIVCEQASSLEDVHYKSHTESLSRQVCTIKDSFDISEEFKIDGDLKSVLNIDVDLVVKDSYLGSGFAVVSGDAMVNVLYEDENNQLKKYETTFDYKQEISVNDADKDCLIFADVCPIDYLSKYSVSQGDNCNYIKWESPVNVSAYIYKKEEIELNDDVYSENSILEEHFESREAVNVISKQILEDTVKGEVPMKDGGEITLCGYVFSGVEISSAYIEDDKINIEGVVSVTILYNTSDNLSTQSIIAQFPYISKLPKGDLNSNYSLSVKANIEDMEISMQGSNANLIAKLFFNVLAVSKCDLSILNSVAVKESRKPKDCAMEILLNNKGKSIWDLSKMLGVSSEQIINQNPSITDPISDNDKVVVFYGIKHLK